MLPNMSQFWKFFTQLFWQAPGINTVISWDWGYSLFPISHSPFSISHSPVPNPQSPISGPNPRPSPQSQSLDKNKQTLFSLLVSLLFIFYFYFLARLLAFCQALIFFWLQGCFDLATCRCTIFAVNTILDFLRFLEFLGTTLPDAASLGLREFWIIFEVSDFCVN